MKAFKAVNIINRGRKSEIPVGTLFVPGSAKDRDDLLSLGAITDLTDAEQALFEKTSGAQVSADEVEAETEESELDLPLSRDQQIAKLEEDNNRAQLDSLAFAAGIADAESLPNKKAVATAIVDAPADMVG